VAKAAITTERADKRKRKRKKRRNGKGEATHKWRGEK
jgi:hypothetical protein